MECKKKTFTTKQEATNRLTEILSGVDSDPTKDDKILRAYQCDKCGLFHLTSMTKKAVKDKKKFNSPASRLERKIENIANEWIKKKGW